MKDSWKQWILDYSKDKEWKKRIHDWANNFRAGDYAPTSGATKVVATNQKQKSKRNQWGW